MEKYEVEGDETAKIALLRVFRGETEIERRAFAIKERISIGRNPYTDTSLDDGTVSRLHAEIHREGKDFVLHNRSENGTIVNGEPVTRRVLGDRDVITIGTFSVIVDIQPDSRSSLYDEARAEGLTMDEARTISCARAPCAEARR